MSYRCNFEQLEDRMVPSTLLDPVFSSFTPASIRSGALFTINGATATNDLIGHDGMYRFGFESADSPIVVAFSDGSTESLTAIDEVYLVRNGPKGSVSADLSTSGAPITVYGDGVVPPSWQAGTAPGADFPTYAAGNFGQANYLRMSWDVNYSTSNPNPRFGDFDFESISPVTSNPVFFGVHSRDSAGNTRFLILSTGETPPPVINNVDVTIAGSKIQDLNGDGSVVDDPKIGWASINFDDNNILADGVLSSTSSSDAIGYTFLIRGTSVNNGPFSFVLVPNTGDVIPLDAAKTYHVYETTDPAWTQTFGAGGYTVSLNETTGYVTVTDANAQPVELSYLDFANFKNINICGMKYEDHNGNGFGDATHPPSLTPLAKYTISLYQDANANGVYDAGIDTLKGTAITADGTGALPLGAYCFTNLGPGTYFVVETLPNSSWVQTGGGNVNPTDQVFHNYYTNVASSGQNVANDDFANMHLVGSGGLTLGFWSNKNGQALISEADLKALRALHLRYANGTDFDPTTAAQVKNFLVGSTSATATNMANMLSAQLIAMTLNVQHGFCNASAVVDLNASALQTWSNNGEKTQIDDTMVNEAILFNSLPPISTSSTPLVVPTTTLSGAATITIEQVMHNADVMLTYYYNATSSSGDVRLYEESLKIVLDALNNNLAIVIQP